MLIKPKDLEWNLLSYEDENEPLNSIDDDEVIESSFLRRKNPEVETDGPSDDKSTKSTTHQRLATVMKFALPSSCYATMAIREVLRMEVSSGFQATLM